MDSSINQNIHLSEVSIVVETVFQGRSHTQVYSVEVLQGLSQNVSTAMPESLSDHHDRKHSYSLSSLILELEQPQLTVALKDTVHIPQKSLLLLLVIIVRLLSHTSRATDSRILINNLNIIRGI